MKETTVRTGEGENDAHHEEDSEEVYRRDPDEDGAPKAVSSQKDKGPEKNKPILGDQPLNICRCSFKPDTEKIDYPDVEPPLECQGSGRVGK
jgi:hypothetical protein